MKLKFAYLCLNFECEEVFQLRHRQFIHETICPACGESKALSLARVLNRKEVIDDKNNLAIDNSNLYQLIHL